MVAGAASQPADWGGEQRSASDNRERQAQVVVTGTNGKCKCGDKRGS